jgi:hypothetical protein
MDPAEFEAGKQKNEMNRSTCPHCRARLGNFLYADVCPHCHEELKHNSLPLLAAKKKDLQKQQPWPVRLFFRIMRLVES